ncbi:MAG: tail fiber domain-containing protein [Elusimicrobia bacterium]|nr:tail fiber domain-containing protein [Elusimicrobiota bacterium]
MADQNIPVTADGDVTIDCDNDNNSSSQKIIFSHDNGTELMRIQENGRVGIGETNPQNKLHIKIATNLNWLFGYPSDTTAAIAALNDAGSAYVDGRIDALTLQLNGQSGGNVGIGTPSPGALLDVRGSVIINEDGADKDVRIEGDTDANLLFTDASADKVGIGTNAPAAKLQIKCDGSSVDQLRLENSGANGKIWQISVGLDSSPKDITIRNQSDGLTIAAFHRELIGSDNCRSLRIGDASGTQTRFDTLVLGQETTYSGATRDGNFLLFRLDNGIPFSFIHAGFRNQADNGNFQGGYIAFRKVASVDKGTLALAINDGNGTQEMIFLKEDKTIGIGQSTVTSGRFIDTSTGGYLTTGGVWQSTSTRESKKDIRPLEIDQAVEALMALNPIKYCCKADEKEKHVGFIAEDVPELVASRDRKGLSPMDIVGVLTKVVQAQQTKIDEITTRLASKERGHE